MLEVQTSCLILFLRFSSSNGNGTLEFLLQQQFGQSYQLIRHEREKSPGKECDQTVFRNLLQKIVSEICCERLFSGVCCKDCFGNLLERPFVDWQGVLNFAWGTESLQEVKRTFLREWVQREFEELRGAPCIRHGCRGVNRRIAQIRKTFSLLGRCMWQSISLAWQWGRGAFQAHFVIVMKMLKMGHIVVVASFSMETVLCALPSELDSNPVRLQAQTWKSCDCHSGRLPTFKWSVAHSMTSSSLHSCFKQAAARNQSLKTREANGWMGWVQMVVSSKQLQESKASHGNGCFLFFKLRKKILPYLPCEDSESALGLGGCWRRGKKYTGSNCFINILVVKFWLSVHVQILILHEQFFKHHALTCKRLSEVFDDCFSPHGLTDTKRLWLWFCNAHFCVDIHMGTFSLVSIAGFNKPSENVVCIITMP